MLRTVFLIKLCVYMGIRLLYIPIWLYKVYIKFYNSFCTI